MSTPVRWTHEAILAATSLWRDATGEWPAKNDWNPSMRRRHIASLLKNAAKHGESISLFESGDFPSDWIVRREYGSWNAFLVQLQGEPRPLGRQPRTIPPKRVDELRIRNEQRPEPPGAALLKRSLQHVAEAQREHDRLMLRGALYDLAATAVAWMDSLDEDPDLDTEAQAA